MRRAAIQSRYAAASGRSAASTSAAPAIRPSASIDSLTSGGSKVFVASTSAAGSHAVRTPRQAPPVTSQSAETPWPVAYSGVSA